MEAKVLSGDSALSITQVAAALHFSGQLILNRYQDKTSIKKPVPLLYAQKNKNGSGKRDRFIIIITQLDSGLVLLLSNTLKALG